jgi:ribonuclease R
MKKRTSSSSHQNRGGTPYDEPWKTADVLPAKSAGKPQASAGVPSVEAVLARLRQSPGSLDDLIGYFKLKKLPEQTALEKRLLELGRSGQVRLDRRGRLETTPLDAVPPATPAPAVKPAATAAKPVAVEAVSKPAHPPMPKPSAAEAKVTLVVDVPTPPAKSQGGMLAAAKSAAQSLSRLISGPPASAAPATRPSLPAAAKPAAGKRAASVAPAVAQPPKVGDELGGKVSAHRDGFGFVVVDGPGEDVFLPAREMRGLMTGDRVRVRLTNVEANGRLSGEFVAMLSTAPRFVVGRLRREAGRWLVTPDNQKAQPFELSIAAADLGGAKDGQVVRAEMLSLPGSRNAMTGRVTEIVGEHLAPGLEIEIALRRHDLPHEFPPEVEAEAEAFGPEVRAADSEGRVDLRKLPLMTIDGIDARDFDDAVYAEKVRGGYRLVVAIADVSAYVEPGSPLDEEATKRGTSVYFPRRVIPMLPEALSNGLCSLNPNVDRLCLVCDMKLGKDGEVSAAKFYEAVMRSQARLIYEDVATMLAEPKGELARSNAKLLPHLQDLDAVFTALFAARQQRGAIDFEGQETKFEFTDDRKIERIVPVQRTRAHRLIEECMIAANIEAAKFVSGRETPALHRVHERPDPQRVQVLKDFLAGRALTLGGGEEPQAKDFATVTEAARGRPDTGLIHMMILRTMAQARYSPEPLGHYGLALEHYAHFTSPIRRYPDLLLHRAVKHIVKRRKPTSFPYSQEQMEALGLHCSMTERRADEATRDVSSWLKCEFMSHRVGDSFDGVVSAVTAFGLFVDLSGLYIDGLVHISALGEEAYQFDPKTQRLVGRRSGHAYSLGQPIRVQVVRVNLEERKIDLVPAAATSERGSEPVHRARTDSTSGSAGYRAAAKGRHPKPQDSSHPPSNSRRPKKRR